MLHHGARAFGGDISEPHDPRIMPLLDEFVEIVAVKVEQRNLRRAVVRSMLECSTVNLLDSKHFFVAAEKATSGLPTTLSLHYPDETFTLDQALDIVRWEVGFD